MLKWLTIIAGVILIGTVVCVARYDKLHNTEGKGYEIKCTESSDPAATTGTMICSAEHNQNAKSGQYDPFWWHIFFAWPEGITALLLLLTLGAVIWQATLMHHHAVQFEKLAEATKKQVDSMTASERAWLTAKVLDFEEPPPKSNMIWIEIPISNHGKTPARVHSIAATSKLVPVPKDAIADATPGKLPGIPEYSDPNRVIELRGYDIIIAPGDTFKHLHVYIWPKEWNLIKISEFTLYVYGTIEYFDTVGKDLHTTRFCSIYSIPAPNFGEPTGFMFSPCIPATYFCAT
jgi:hypothetical protein